MDVTRGAEIDARGHRGGARVRPDRHPGEQRRHRSAQPRRSVTEADFDHTLAVNLKGTFFVSQAVGRVMIRKAAAGSSTSSSQAGVVALPTESVYCMTKAAIAHLTKCLAVEWAPTASTSTPSRRPSSARRHGEVAGGRRVPHRPAGAHPARPRGRAGRRAGAVVFLASPAAALITGATLLIDGGFTAPLTCRRVGQSSNPRFTRWRRRDPKWERWSWRMVASRGRPVVAPRSCKQPCIDTLSGTVAARGFIERLVARRCAKAVSP